MKKKKKINEETRIQEIYLKVSSSLQSLIIVVYYFLQYQRRTTLSAWYKDSKYVSPLWLSLYSNINSIEIIHLMVKFFFFRINWLTFKDKKSSGFISFHSQESANAPLVENKQKEEEEEENEGWQSKERGGKEIQGRREGRETGRIQMVEH